MLDSLRRSAIFSGVQVVAFAVMDNHVHILFQVPAIDPGTVPEDAGTVPEDEVLARYGVLAGEEKARELKERLDGMSERGNLLGREAALNRLRVRMYDLSQFVKTFKEVFGRRFRKIHPYSGTIWGDRFKSCLIESGEYLAKCAKYIELNPVRARMVKHAEDYTWNTTGLAKRGDAFAKACLDWMRSVFSGDSPQEGG